MHEMTVDTSGPRVTAVLLNWRRPDNIPAIVTSILAYDFVDEVIVWNNSNKRLSGPWTELVRVFEATMNIGCYARYIAARFMSHNDLIYTQDDDYLVGNMGDLYEAALRQPDCITAAIDEAHWGHHEKRAHHGRAHEVLLGWGAFFDRRLVAPAFSPYVHRYGANGQQSDEILYRDADRIFSLMLNRPHQLLSADVTELPGVGGAEAISKQRGHAGKIAEARRRALELIGEKEKPCVS